MKRKQQSKVRMDRDGRMKWWKDSRFGMFVHWGLYSQLGRHEWVMNKERIPVSEYKKLADSWEVKKHPARAWARLAKKAGMKYMVMTTKHHEGFCLWDTKMTNYNAVNHSPGRDLVKEYVEACREFGIKVGFYYSLIDWYHADGARCASDEASRRRFIDFTHGCVKELMSNYGKIDILWYDVPWPLKSPEQWKSKKMNRMVRKLQPEIIINDRSMLPEDYDTPEEHIKASEEERPWEACMTFNGSWGYMPYALPEDWHSTRQVLSMLQQVTAGGGNLLLNIGPEADGTIPDEAIRRLTDVGKWLKKNGEAVYGKVDKTHGFFEWNPLGSFTLKGKTAYFWCTRWPGREITFGGFCSKLKTAILLSNGKTIQFEQKGNRLTLKGLPKSNPDKIANTAIIKMEFKSRPKQQLGFGCVVL